MAGSDIPTEDASAVAGLVDAMSAMVDVLSSADSVEQTLESVLELATTTIEGCDFAGIILLNDGVASIRAYTHPDVLELEALKVLPRDSLFLQSIRDESIIYNEDSSKVPKSNGARKHERGTSAVCWGCPFGSQEFPEHLPSSPAIHRRSESWTEAEGFY